MLMPLVQDITHDLTQAMKAREEPRLSTLRMLKAELQKLQADKGKGVEITDDDVHSVIKRLIKQRKDAAEQYRQAEQVSGQSQNSRRFRFLSLTCLTSSMTRNSTR